MEARSPGAVDEAIDRNRRNLRVRGIGFRSLTEALDTTTAQGLVFHMFGALAEFERSLIRERTQAGLATFRRKSPSAMTGNCRAVAPGAHHLVCR